MPVLFELYLGSLTRSAVPDLLKRIETRSATVFKNARPKPGAPAQELSSKDQQSLDKIPLEWSKITEHQAEKSALAERLLTLVNRARERGRDEWRKVATADEYETGVDPHESDLVDKVVAGSEVAVLGVLQGLKAQAGSVGLVGALQKGGLLPPTPGASTPTDEKMVKSGLSAWRPSRRLLTAIPRSERKTGMFTNMPPPATPLATSNIANSNYAPSVAASNHRKRRAQSPSESVPPSAMDGDEMDGEGEEDDGNGDDALYCICQQKSYGEMIGCDNDDCRYEWVGGKGSVRKDEALICVVLWRSSTSNASNSSRLCLVGTACPHSGLPD